MKLDDYFENTNGVGVLSTADDKGKVNAAIYGRPHLRMNILLPLLPPID